MKTITFIMSNNPEALSDFHSYRLLSIGGKPVARPEGYVKKDFVTYGYELDPEEVVATVDGYSGKGEQSFISAFVDAAPMEYTHEEDFESPAPICAPWHWASEQKQKEIWLGDDPSECGKRWAEYCQRNGYFDVFLYHEGD